MSHLSKKKQRKCVGFLDNPDDLDNKNKPSRFTLENTPEAANIPEGAKYTGVCLTDRTFYNPIRKFCVVPLTEIVSMTCNKRVSVQGHINMIVKLDEPTVDIQTQIAEFRNSSFSATTLVADNMTARDVYNAHKRP
jgi:hypothetical protein